MIDNIFLVIVMLAGLVWVAVGVAEQVYNGCKRRAAKSLLKRSIAALGRTVQVHEGCDCPACREAVRVIRAYHQQGGKL